MRIYLMFLSVVVAAGTCQAQKTDLDADIAALDAMADKAADDAAAAALDAMADKAADDAAASTIDTEDKALVDAAMKRTDEGAATEELDRLPLPNNGPFTATDYALSLPAAWTNRSARLHKSAQASIGVQMLATEGGRLNYLERACGTGQERVVAAQVIGLLPRVVTKYPERMLLGGFIIERNHGGFAAVRGCNRDALATARTRFERYYVEVSKLAIMGSEGS